MKTIIIGAGRGRRLDHLTATQPKPFTEIGGKRILDWILEAHAHDEIQRVEFIGGYLMDCVRTQYPQLSFHHNDNWENNNILQSLFYAAPSFSGGFISSYGDILYTPEIVRALIHHPAPICLAIDTDWRNRYRFRRLHPTTDAEKVCARGTRITKAHRGIPDDEANGEFVGLAKFSPEAAQLFLDEYKKLDPDFLFEGTIPLNKAYLIHFLNYLLQKGIPMEFVTTHGHYIEVDTLEDYAYALHNWPPAPYEYKTSAVPRECRGESAPSAVCTGHHLA